MYNHLVKHLIDARSKGSEHIREALINACGSIERAINTGEELHDFIKDPDFLLPTDRRQSGPGHVEIQVRSDGLLSELLGEIGMSDKATLLKQLVEALWDCSATMSQNSSANEKQKSRSLTLIHQIREDL